MNDLDQEIPLSNGESLSTIKTLPAATRRRLVLLLNLLEKAQTARVTSVEISRLLGCKDTLVRYDFRFIKLPGGAKNGYDVERLKNSIQEKIRSDSSIDKNCCIVGLGRLGAALLDDGIFEGSGFKVCAGFDSSVNRVELLRSTFELFPASRIETVCREKKIEYAFLCCPEKEVERMVQRLIAAGIKGIVNYTRSVFEVPENIKIENVSPVVALQNM